METARRHPTQAQAWSVLVIAFLSVTALISLTPLWWMIVTAFTKPEITLQFPPKLLPIPPTLHNLEQVLKFGQMGRWFLNTVIVSVSVTVLSVFLASMAGYALAKKKFPGNNLFLWLYIASMMIPAQVSLVPRYMLVSKLGILDTYWVLILPMLASASSAFLVKQYMTSLPSALIESGVIDGAGEWRIYTSIIFPLAMQGLAVLIVMTFAGEWNSFIWVLISTNSLKMRNLQAGLTYMQELYPMQHADVMAASTLSAIPMFVLFFSLQRYFLKGITVGAIKG
jgi:multiple sugar transport system permease protein